MMTARCKEAVRLWARWTQARQSSLKDHATQLRRCREARKHKNGTAWYPNSTSMDAGREDLGLCEGGGRREREIT
jgi:hypothetical protein